MKGCELLPFVARFYSKSQLTDSYSRQGGVSQLLLRKESTRQEESTWFESRGRAWHEGEKDLLESWTVFVAQSEERDAGDGLFLKRRVNLNDPKLVSSFKSECLVLGNSRKLGGLLLWPKETEGRGELRFLDPFLVGGDGILVGGDGRHEHQRE